MAEPEQHTAGSADYYDALLGEAARRLVHTIEPFRVLTRDELRTRSGAGRWRTITFGQALEWAVANGMLHRLSSELYEIPAASSAGATTVPISGSQHGGVTSAVTGARGRRGDETVVPDVAAPGSSS